MANIIYFQRLREHDILKHLSIVDLQSKAVSEFKLKSFSVCLSKDCLVKLILDKRYGGEYYAIQSKVSNRP